MLRTMKQPQVSRKKKKGNIEKDQNDFGFLNSNIVSEVNIAVPS